MRGDLRAVFPVMAQLPDKVERSGGNDGVVRSGSVERIFECGFWIRDDGEMRGMMRRDFRKLGDGNGARGTWLCEDHFGSVRKENAGNFVDSFVAQRPKNQPDFATRKVLFQESREFSCGRGIVRAVEVQVRPRLELFQPPRPDCFRDSLNNRAVRNTIATILEIPRGGDGVETVLYLELAGKPRRKLKRPTGSILADGGAAATVFHPFLFDTKRGSGFDDRRAKFRGTRADDFQSFWPLLGQDERNARLENARLFRGNFRERMT